MILNIPNNIPMASLSEFAKENGYYLKSDNRGYLIFQEINQPVDYPIDLEVNELEEEDGVI